MNDNGEDEDEDGDEENYILMEIGDWKKKGRSGYQFLYQMEKTLEEEDGTRKTIIGWGDLKDIFADCQFAVDSNVEQSNFLIDYVKKLGDEAPNEMMEQLARLSKMHDISTMFPVYGKSSDEEVMAPCSANHDKLCTTIYLAVEIPYYFRQGYKWHGSSCRQCKKPIGVSPGEIKPSFKFPVYVCEVYSKDKSNCQEMVCNTCFVAPIKHSETTNCETGAVGDLPTNQTNDNNNLIPI